MDSQNHRFLALILLITSSIICSQSQANGTGSVFFLDSSTHQYLRSRSSESKPMLLPEVGAAVSVLLGFAPPPMISSSSSEKLDQVLMPNPFDRPRAVFVLEITGVEDQGPDLGSNSDVFSSALKRRVDRGQNDADIQLSDEEEVSVISLNDPLPVDTKCTDEDLSEFASWLGGSYVSNTLEPLSGVLTVPLENGVQVKLHMSKSADREFTTGLIFLIYNAQRALQMHQDLSGSMHKPAELVKGRFDGVKALREQYGTDDIVKHGVELLMASLSRIYSSLQTAYTGQLVGVVLFNRSPAKEPETMLTVKLPSRPAARWLEEKKGSPNATMIAEVVLVRRTLAWLTGIILIIATLLGIYFLMYMPLTRDTLLYSNVKLD